MRCETSILLLSVFGELLIKGWKGCSNGNENLDIEKRSTFGAG